MVELPAVLRLLELELILNVELLSHHGVSLNLRVIALKLKVF